MSIPLVTCVAALLHPHGEQRAKACVVPARPWSRRRLDRPLGILVYGSLMPGEDRAVIIGETSENLLKLYGLF
jgi:hypothetical protein